MELGRCGREQAPDDYNIDGLLGGSAPAGPCSRSGRTAGPMRLNPQQHHRIRMDP